MLILIIISVDSIVRKSQIKALMLFGTTASTVFISLVNLKSGKETLEAEHLYSFAVQYG